MLDIGYSPALRDPSLRDGILDIKFSCGYAAPFPSRSRGTKLVFPALHFQFSITSCSPFSIFHFSIFNYFPLPISHFPFSIFNFQLFLCG